MINRNSVTDKLDNKNWYVGRTREALYMKHSPGQKVKGKGHKIMRRSCTKHRMQLHDIYLQFNVQVWQNKLMMMMNMSRKRHSVVEIHLSYRKSRSPERMAWPHFWLEVRK